VPRNNMFKLGIAGAAAGAGAILAITSVFAHSAPTTGNTSIVGGIVSVAKGASLPDFTRDTASNALIVEQDQDAAEAAALAAQIAAEQQKAAAELAAEQAAEAADATETDEDAAETETPDALETDQQAAETQTEHSGSGGD
jgi:hypothetical protein